MKDFGDIHITNGYHLYFHKIHDQQNWTPGKSRVVDTLKSI